MPISMAVRGFLCIILIVRYLVLTNAFLDMDPRTVKKGLEAFANVVDAVNIASQDKKCSYKCPTGYRKSVNYSHIPTSNGCGSLGVDVDLSHLSSLEACCDEHDVCYDTCKMDKEKCDNSFYQCLMNSCTRMSSKRKRNDAATFTINTCKITAGLIYQGVVSLGCKSYLDAQKNACKCVLYNQREDL
uniref:Uncharacterized protein LOC100176290 n=1 Tax=Phallusia mammillata TaxID=59560 RepID=A0A6F9DGH4_9ASCI|nr:uncharacterized protein LOC100176290 [Phallusia mammillata]